MSIQGLKGGLIVSNNVTYHRESRRHFREIVLIFWMIISRKGLPSKVDSFHPAESPYSEFLEILRPQALVLCIDFSQSNPQLILLLVVVQRNQITKINSRKPNGAKCCHFPASSSFLDPKAPRP